MTDARVRNMRHTITAQRKAITALLAIIGCLLCAMTALAAATAKAYAAASVEPPPIEICVEGDKVCTQKENAENVPQNAIAEVEPIGETMTVKATAYCPCEKCCGEWADGITYTGTTATEGRTIAVDPKVIPLGSRVYINGSEYIAEDIGGAIKGERIDIFYTTHEAALEWGVQNITVTVFE